ncbi:MAG: hypothetical protein MJ188_03105 [Treponema sp.]|nr:hypothetical protein [Treponema sp.]
MDNNRITVIVGLVCISTIISWLMVKGKKNAEQMGNCVYGFPKKIPVGMLAVDFMAIVFLLILLFRDFGFMSVIFAAIAVLAVYIITRDGGNYKYFGVYEKGIIAPSALIFYEDIMTFPVFELPLDEQAHYPKNTLVVVTKTKGKQEIVFDSEEQCQKVVEELKGLEIIKNSEGNVL